ncbi:MAG: YjbQ family protein [Bacillota bacterium]
MKSVLVGHSVTLIVEKGALVLGRWQDVYFAEFDGPRRRLVYVRVVGSPG